jgi:hypothetical protein
MSLPDDLREERNRLERLRWAIEGRNHASHSPRRYVGKVVTAPSAVPAYVPTNPVKISGPIAEGGSPTYAVDTTRVVPVLVLGTVPSAGQNLIAKNYRGRWVVQLRGSSGGGDGGWGTIPNCFCTQIPINLTMTSADPTCNFRMFQSCSISYGPHPGFESLNFGHNYYLSDQGFPDPVANGATFYYALLCQFNQFSLTRAYLTSPYGSPFRDGILYTWLVGGSGNNCAPFHLDNGTAFPGSDPRCRVMIDGA